MTCCVQLRNVIRKASSCEMSNQVRTPVRVREMCVLENFLFLNNEPNSPLKAIDFGLARYCSTTGTLSARAGTPLYIAPEVLRRAYGQSADLWSAGVIAYQVL